MYLHYAWQGPIGLDGPKGEPVSQNRHVDYHHLLYKLYGVDFPFSFYVIYSFR